MAVIIHGVASSTYCRSARMFCVEVGIDHELRPIRGSSPSEVLATLKSPDHRILHPFGRMPALEDDGIVVFETSAVGRYIAAKYGDGRLVPSDMREAARMEQWISAANCYIIPDTVGRFISQYVFRDQPDMDAVNEAKPILRSHFEILDQAIEGRATIAGDGVTIADILIAPVLHVVGGLPGGMDLFGGLANLGRWWDAISSRRSFAETDPQRPASQAA